ncbi:L,D-transpeptidase family protein [Nocardioides sp.]|uniref:L,D-transpeptidase family protein n=1 Tax=Nocardioides sp. TaxID=35761 RepID=UPI003D1400F1
MKRFPLAIHLMAVPLLATGLLVPASAPAAPSPATGPTHGPAASSTLAATTVRLDGVRVGLRPGTTQVVTVNHTTGYRARLVLWRKGAGGWERRLEAKGRIGYGGLVLGTRRKQGTGTTPLGTYRLLSSFGTHAQRPGWDLSHRVIRAGDYWVQDNRSAYYNRYRNKAQGGFRWWLPSSNDNSSERLRDYRQQYEFSLVTGFNYAGQVRHRGSGIFLHVNGSGATAGCVSGPRPFLKALMVRLDPARVPVIAIGR